MKLDYFAEFRNPHVESSGNAGNVGTDANNPRNSERLSARHIVPHNSKTKGTGEQASAVRPHQAVPGSPASQVRGNEPTYGKHREKAGDCGAGSPVPDVPPEQLVDEEGKAVRYVPRNSRSPLIADEVRTKIEAIEGDARAKGWPAELLWNNAFWDLPRGLAAVLDDNDEIVAVDTDAITILKLHKHLTRFLRRQS